MGDNAYNHTSNKMKIENKAFPTRKHFFPKPLSFIIPNKKLSQRLDYNSVEVRETSPLYFSGDKNILLTVINNGLYGS